MIVNRNKGANRRTCFIHWNHSTTRNGDNLIHYKNKLLYTSGWQMWQIFGCMCDRNSCTLVACDDVHFSLFLPSQSDDYNSVPALDPEKLKIFNTVREITGVCVCVHLCVCFQCHITGICNLVKPSETQCVPFQTSSVSSRGLETCPTCQSSPTSKPFRAELFTSELLLFPRPCSRDCFRFSSWQRSCHYRVVVSSTALQTWSDCLFVSCISFFSCYICFILF